MVKEQLVGGLVVGVTLFASDLVGTLRSSGTCKLCGLPGAERSS